MSGANLQLLFMGAAVFITFVAVVIQFFAIRDINRAIKALDEKQEGFRRAWNLQQHLTGPPRISSTSGSPDPTLSLGRRYMSPLTGWETPIDTDGGTSSKTSADGGSSPSGASESQQS